jgi:hypothetical protein
MEMFTSRLRLHNDSQHGATMNTFVPESVRNRCVVRNRWLVTGVAGFIGSNLLETLLRLDQKWSAGQLLHRPPAQPGPGPEAGSRTPSGGVSG